MPTSPALPRPALLLAALAALSGCHRDVTSPTAAAARPLGAYVPPSEGSAGVDSTVVGPAPVPLQGGTATVPVTVYSGSTPDGTPVTVECGGSTATGTTTGGVATVSCTYAEPGVHRVTTTVGGGTPVPAAEYAVVYDPRGGFVTGGGWIASPAGAVDGAPTLAGRASFGFVAKYLPGRQTPDGETEFQFRAAGLNFHGGVYQWLVVSGARAQYRGTGTVNNAGRYDFVVTAIDGDLVAKGTPDRFRIRIADQATGAVVYDNRRDGAEVNADAATELASGSISIKK